MMLQVRAEKRGGKWRTLHLLNLSHQIRETSGLLLGLMGEEVDRNGPGARAL